MIIYLALFVAFVGLVVFLAASEPKAAEVGRIMFWVGLLAFLLVAPPHLLTVVK